VTNFETTIPWFQTTKEAEIAQAISTTATHVPTVAYHIKDAVLFDGSIYAGRFRHSIADKSLFVSGVAHKLPDVLDRVEFGAFRRQGDNGDVGRHNEARR
jgi:hypothetical protein